uniref:Uncharacterized protein n=1 Tax=Oryza sativa subsp. japonica TaxID=39947 RepID=Q2R1P6_ORYSJ|nr:hypothetical protein LOC_Os11g38510 [Oryza sativa Japonica Group]
MACAAVGPAGGGGPRARRRRPEGRRAEGDGAAAAGGLQGSGASGRRWPVRAEEEAGRAAELVM